MKRVILGCVLLCVFLPAAAHAVAKARFAIETRASVRVGYNEGADRLLAVPGAVRHSNTQVARVPISWPQIEEDDDDFDWEMLDRVVALLRGAHIRPMISIYGSPRWAGADTPGIHCPCDRAADPEWRRCGSRSRFATRMRCSTTGTSPTTPRTAASASPGLIFHRLWSPFSKHAGIFSWDAGLSALARNGAPTRLYRRIGTLHPGFHPPAFKPHPGGDIIVTTPPPPALSGPPKSPTPCTG